MVDLEKKTLNYMMVIISTLPSVGKQLFSIFFRTVNELFTSLLCK